MTEAAQDPSAAWRAFGGRQAGSPGSRLPLWFGVLAGPLAWTVHLLVSYALVPVACATGLVVVLHLVTLVTGGVTVSAGIVAFRSFPRLRDGGARGASQFMANSGVLGSGLFLFAILIEGLPNLVLSPCR